MSRAVVLLSGGLDSATALAIALADGHRPYALSFRYGQRHATEIASARAVALASDVADHRIVEIDLGEFGGSALTDLSIDVPKGRVVDEMEAGIPVTYVPARNTIFLAFALAYAEVVDARQIYLGVNALDYSGYPDCRPEFIGAFQRLADVATVRAVNGDRVEIRAPLINMTKAEIIAEGLALGVDYSLTSSCYDPTSDGACGECDSCTLRLAGFDAAGIDDPIGYR